MSEGRPLRTPTLVVALTLQGRPALMLGGGPEAVQKTHKLLDAGARVTLVSPEVDASLSALAQDGRLSWFARDVHESDLRGQRVVVLSDRDPERAAWLRSLRQRHGFLLATVDQPATCDFYFTAKVDAGPVEISLSSGGSAPLLLRRMREALAPAFDERFQQFAEGLVQLRARLAGRPIGERRRALSRALDGFAIELRLRYPDSVERPSGQGDSDREKG